MEVLAVAEKRKKESKKPPKRYCIKGARIADLRAALEKRGWREDDGEGGGVGLQWSIKAEHAELLALAAAGREHPRRAEMCELSISDVYDQPTLAASPCSSSARASPT